MPPKLVGGVVPGTLLNPLNSSMIAVALVELQRDFGVGVAMSTWLISAFYLSAAVGQPLMGRLVDLYGPRRLYMGGLVLTLGICTLAPFAPGFWWLVAARTIQGLGTSAAYPAALVLFRAAAAPSGAAPAGAIAVVGIVAGGSAALGPVVGGILIALGGWGAIFWANVPITIVALVVAHRVLPTTTRASRGSARELAHELDLPGVALFTATIAALLMFLLSLADSPQWIFAPLALAAGAGLVVREWSAPEPFLDLRGIARNRALASLLAQQGGVNLVFYVIFFGLPMWLESVRGIPVSQVGLLMLPLAAVSLISMPLTARAIRRRGVRPVLILGSVLIVCSTLAMQGLNDTTPIALIVVLVLVLGVPSGLTNLALQTGLFSASPGERMGSSSGLFQTFRYLGAIMASSALGIWLEGNLTSSGLHSVGLLAVAAGLGLVLLALALPRHHPSR